jgi:hypothetical protein
MPLLYLTKAEYRALQQVVFEALASRETPYAPAVHLVRKLGLDYATILQARQRRVDSEVYDDLIARAARGESIDIPPFPAMTFEQGER